MSLQLHIPKHQHNTTPTQREALGYNWRLRYISMTVIRWLSNRDILKIYEIAFQSYLLKLIAHFAPHTLIENKYLIKKNKSHKPKQKINQFIFIKLDLGSIITVD